MYFPEIGVLNQYKNTHAFNNFRSANQYAFSWSIDLITAKAPFEVLVTNRSDIYNQMDAMDKTCNDCKIHGSTTESLLGFKL